MNKYDLLLVLFFGLWLCISVVFQRKTDRITKLRAKDFFHLIPNWRFFAPIPARKDYHLEFRVKYSKSEISKWQRISLYPSRTPLSVIWYPEKRLRKSFNTSIRRITRMVKSSGHTYASRCLSYLNLLVYLQNQNPKGTSLSLQFRIISQQDFADNIKTYLVFNSDWHLQNPFPPNEL